MNATTIITEQAAAILRQVAEYLRSEIVAVEIENEQQRRAAVALGNELQKKKTEIESLKKAERLPYVESLESCDSEFNGVIAAIKEKQSHLSEAIGAYTLRVREEERRLIAAVEETAKAQAEKLEADAATADDRRKYWVERCQVASANMLDNASDPLKYAKASREFAIASRWATHWEAKAAEKTAKAAASAIEPVAIPELPTGNITKAKGQRTTFVYSVVVVDKAAAIRWAAENPDENNVVDLNMMALKNIAKASDCKRQIPGVRFSKTEQVGFSGR